MAALPPELVEVVLVEIVADPDFILVYAVEREMVFLSYSCQFQRPFDSLARSRSDYVFRILETSNPR